MAKPPGRRLRCARQPTQKWLPNPPRRQFSAAYRLRIVQEADGCTASGELGQLLRRQGLYSLQLSNWLDVKGRLQGLAPKKRGAKATQRDPRDGKVRELEAKVVRLEGELHKAHTILKQGVQPNVVTLHCDRGAPMTSKCTARLLADLGITRSLSRPQVSDDNPFAAAQFKTLKFHPSLPGRFQAIDAATGYCRSLFPWYNLEHRHSGLSMLTPHDVHYGRAEVMLAQRQHILDAPWAKHPKRFVRGQPKPGVLPEAVWINPPNSTAGDIAQQIQSVSVSKSLTGSGALDHRVYASEIPILRNP